MGARLDIELTEWRRDCLAVIGAIVATAFLWAILLRHTTHVGWTLTVGAPATLGLFLASRWRGARPMLVVVGILSVMTAVGIVVVCGAAGLFCAVMAIFAGIAGLGVGLVAGVILQGQPLVGDLLQRGWVWLVLAGALLLAGVLEDLAAPRPLVVRVATQADFAVPPDRLWSALASYDEVEAAGLLIRLGLPRPVAVEGERDGVGSRQHCRYDKGSLDKITTRWFPPLEYAFAVERQALGMERAVRLRSVSFTLQPRLQGTRLVLRTEYQAPLRPRLLWGPLERLSVRVVHRHVIERIRSNLGEPGLLVGRQSARAIPARRAAAAAPPPPDLPGSPTSGFRPPPPS